MGMTREEVISTLKVWIERDKAMEYADRAENIEIYKMAIKALEQQPKTGRWLDKKTTIKGGHGLAYGRYGCSVCKKKQPSKTDFCPNCGADMRINEE